MRILLNILAKSENDGSYTRSAVLQCSSIQFNSCDVNEAVNCDKIGDPKLLKHSAAWPSLYSLHFISKFEP